MHSLIGKFFGLESNITGRAISEIRRCVPVLIYSDEGYLLVFASELLEEQSFAALAVFDNVSLLLTAQRAAFVSPYRALTRVCTQGKSLPEIRALLTEPPEADLLDATPSTNPLDPLAIDLVKMAKLLPSALIVDMQFASFNEMDSWCNRNNILHINSEVIYGWRKEYDLKEVCRSDLYLKDSLRSKIIVYRSNMAEPEHYAIIIGDPNMDNLIVRLHSSCYTGDLLGSLSCDCRSQLLSSVKLLSEQNGGAVLYISQEGRGIGLANKIRAYGLQMQNAFDTVDANRFLGFDADERVFLPAALILKNLGVSRLQLLTSNPQKVQAISKYGLSVTRVIPFHTEVNKYNSDYIKTKKTRLGHTNIVASHYTCTADDETHLEI